MKPLARRTDELRQSDIRAVSQMVSAVDGINLGQGICDLPTPPALRSAAIEAVHAGHATYSHYAGIEPLRKYIYDKAREYNGIPVTSPDEIVVGVGSTGAFATTILALLNPGDEVILFEPFYGYHVNLVRAVGGAPVSVSQTLPDWDVDFDEVEDAVTDRTKAIVVTTPGNPNGKVWKRTELEQLLSIAIRHDLWIITDEIYEYIVYDEHVHLSAASLPGAYERTITISGFSKTFNMTGWRLGYAVAPSVVAEKVGLLSDLFYICAPTPLQHGVAAANGMTEDYFNEMRVDYARKRYLMCRTLEEAGFVVHWPQGAYYVLADVTPLAERMRGFENDRAACKTLIDTCGIGSVSGSSFFTNKIVGSRYLRFCFAKEMDELEIACSRLREAFAVT
ncbi:MAG: pyridoxal phosphate-dependent aminotransferase [Rhodothermales bacterium]|nr:pyridoxal phosphate-dependent aminotransferase [Rhodothermales bacterium]